MYATNQATAQQPTETIALAEVPRELQRLQKGMDLIEQSLSSLQAQLEPVTLPPTPAEAPSGAVASCGSQHGQALSHIADFAHSLADRIVYIRRKLAI